MPPFLPLLLLEAAEVAEAAADDAAVALAAALLPAAPLSVTVN